MKRILLSALLAVLLCIPWTQLSAQRITSTVIVADGTATENHVPVYGFYCDQSQAAQMIYPASELLDLSTGDTITKLHFFVYSGSSSAWSSASFEVRLANTTQADLSTSYDQTASTLVYTGTLSADVTNGMEVTLTTPFEYTGGNLLVDFRLPSSSGYTQCYFYGITSTGGGRYHYGNSSITSGGTVVNFLAKCEFTVRTIAPTCYPVTDLVASNVTATSADFSWTASGQGETQYQYLCIPATDTINWANAQTATTTSATVTGLNSNTNYKCYVRSYCSATDQSKAVYTAFRTPCAAVDPASLGVIGFETSEGFATGSGNFANCWEGGNMQSTSTSYMPYVQANGSSSYYMYARTGSNCLKMQALVSSYTTADSCYAVLPEFTYTGSIASYEAHFYMCKTSTTSTWSNYNDTLYVGIVSDPEDMSDLQIVGYAVNTTTSYAQQIVSFSSYSGTDGYIVFLAAANQNASTSSKYASFYIDDLEIIKGRATRTPVVDSIFNITTTTVDVAFSGSNANSYRIVAATEPVSNPETYTTWAIDTVVTASPATINVQASTNYYLYVQGFGTDTSFFSNPVTQFQSGCDVVASFPWTENFDEFTTSGEFAKVCWFNEHADGPGVNIAKINTSGMGDNETPMLNFPDMAATTYTRVSTPEFNIPTAGAYEFNIDVYRASNYSDKTLEGVNVIVENTTGGYDTTFIPRNYSLPGNVGAETAGNTWYTYTISLPKSGVQRVILLGCNQYGGATYVDNLRVRKTPNCFKVDSVAVRDNQPTQATIEWRNGTSAKYQVLFTSENINPDTLSTVPASVIAFNDSTASNVDSMLVTGLTPATQYYVYVRGLCSDEQSDWSTAIAFRTACQVLTISRTNIYTEGFENIDDNSKVVPCWDINTTSANYPMVYNYEYYAHTGDKCLYFGGYNGGNDTTYMTLPETTNPVNTLRLKFWLKGYSSTQSQYNDSILVGVMTSDAAGNEVFNRIAGFQAQTDDYELYEVNFDEYTGANGRIAIVRAPVEFASSWYSQWWGSNIDDVTIDLVPTCKKPNDFAASNITKQSADLSWTATTASNYEVIVADQSIDPANLDSAALTHIIYNDTTITADSVVLNGLTPLTTYYAYVRGNCGAGDISDWTNELSFQTATGLPYVQDFNVSSFPMQRYTCNYHIDSVIAGTDNLIPYSYAVSYDWNISTTLGGDTSTARFNIYGDNYFKGISTPLLDFTNVQSATLTFDICKRNYSTGVASDDDNIDDKFYVIAVDPTLNNVIALETWGNDTVPGVNDHSLRNEIGQWFSTKTVDIPYTEGAYYIMLFAGSAIDDDDYYIHIDNINLSAVYDSVNVIANVNDTTMGYVTGAGNVVKNDNVTLTAVANQNYHFVSWSNGATTETITFEATQDTTFTATFAPDTFNITALTADSVMGTVTGSGRYPYGYTANLIATPNTGYHFVDWSNGDTTASTFVTVLSDSTITANFAKNQYTVTLVASPDSMGKVYGAGVYNYLDTAMLVAVPDSGYYFRGWTDGFVDDTIYVVIYDNYTDTAFFSAAIPHTVSVDVVGVGTVTGLGTYNEGDVVILTATPGQGYKFDGWSGDTTGIFILDLSSDTIAFEVTRDVYLTATFTEISTSVNDVEASDYVAYAEGQRIVVAGVEGHTVSLFDATGRLVATRTNANETETFDAPIAGVYMIKVNGMNTTAIVVK